MTHANTKIVSRVSTLVDHYTPPIEHVWSAVKAHYLKLLLLSPLQDIDEAQFKRIVVQATELVPKSAYANLIRSSHQHVLSYLEKLRASVHGEQPLIEGGSRKLVWSTDSPKYS